jgi:hypothetical protein
MTKPNPKFGNLTAGQVRDIYRNAAGLTMRQMAIKYGVPEATIVAARREIHHRRNPGQRGRIALVNA